MKLSRAAFLKMCGLALAGRRAHGSTFVATGAAPDAHRVPARAKDQDPASAFRRHLNTAFDVRSADEGRVTLILAEVAEGPVDKNVEQFSLIFHGPIGEVLLDGIHAFHHPAQGRFDLFIVRIGARNGRRAVYQACFSRHVSRRV